MYKNIVYNYGFQPKVVQSIDWLAASCHNDTTTWVTSLQILTFYTVCYLGVTVSGLSEWFYDRLQVRNGYEAI